MYVRCVLSHDILYTQGAHGMKVQGKAYVLPIAIPNVENTKPVSQIELNKDVLLQGILCGFSQAYAILAPVCVCLRVLTYILY